MSVSSVASGGQANRKGAYGLVPSPAETCSQVPRRVHAVQPAHPLPVDAAVGDQRAVERHPQLAAVGVPAQQQVVAVGGEPVEHPGLGGVRQPDPDVGGRVGRPGDLVVAVPLEVRVVDAGEGDPASVDGQLARRRW